MASSFTTNAAARLRRTQQPTARNTTSAGQHPPLHISGTLSHAAMQSSNIGSSQTHYQTSMSHHSAPTQHSTSSTSNSVRRNLFKTLKTASQSMAGAGSRATTKYLQPSSRRKGTVDAPTDTVFDDEDARMKEEEEDVLERNADGEWEINLPELDETVDDDDDDDEEEREQLRLADLVKQHARGDLSRHLPELLRLQVQSLQEDQWMYEEEDTF
ncbi:hypothetical protein BJ508DRAFT_411329 [Ascobolus immersus RN42]|uniref:Uncharacterized protein n=1 Tax=Ascobolus immersus RN42 TaxID=1160509 RepID=A0A3N4IJ18_ASCIM|nr:hypothetical protein BJ508DRAFT_411329 [Ascobolus immersus RN42]